MPVHISDLKAAYANSTVSTRTTDLDAALADENGEKLNAIYGVFTHLAPLDMAQWIAQLVHADGGVQTFELYHRIADQLVWVKTFQQFEELPFDNTINMAFWLNMTEQALILNLAGDERIQAVLHVAAGGAR